MPRSSLFGGRGYRPAGAGVKRGCYPAILPIVAVARAWEVLLAALRLGLTSFGGPVAHIGYFRDEYVTRRRWLDDAAYADLVALCQLLPGPASSQVGIAVGMHRAGLPGGIAAWVGFTAPSAAALILFGSGVSAFDHLIVQGWLRGLKVVAAAVVAFALLGMARSLVPDARRATIAIAAAIAMLLWRSPLAQVLVIVIAAAAGRLLLRGVVPPAGAGSPSARARPSAAVASLALFAVLLGGLPILRQFVTSEPLDVFDAFYRSGSLVFGGGHVVLPLLQAEVVPPGWVTGEQFIAGYGAAQAVPGPLFTFSAYLGTVMEWLARRMERWLVHAPRDLSAFVPAGCRRLAVLGAATDAPSAACGDRGGGSGSRGAAARRALRPRMGHGHPHADGPGTGTGGVRDAGVVEDTAVAGGGLRRGGGSAPHRALSSGP